MRLAATQIGGSPTARLTIRCWAAPARRDPDFDPPEPVFKKWTGPTGPHLSQDAA
jgi:hypothetical protein